MKSNRQRRPRPPPNHHYDYHPSNLHSHYYLHSFILFLSVCMKKTSFSLDFCFSLFLLEEHVFILKFLKFLKFLKLLN